MLRAASSKQKLSRSKIELFTECPRCFWLDVKKGVKRPSFPPYTINNAVDYLLKQEFDVYREKGKPHPIMVANDVDAIPFMHKDLDKWRHNFTGVQYEHEPSGFLVTGAVDDVWVNPHTSRGVGASPYGLLHVVDYKATGAMKHQIYDSYRRQMEIYQWLLRQNGFDVSPVGYFVFAKVSKASGFSANGDLSSDLSTEGLPKAEALAKEEGEYMARLPFDLFVEPLEGDDAWVPGTLTEARRVYELESAPAAGDACEYCRYRGEAGRT